MRIHVVHGDLADQHVDAVVNATGESLVRGGAVSAALLRRGGPTILAELQQLKAGRYRAGLPIGQAVATTAGNLPARWVIHTAGPAYSPDEDRSGLLASCYRASLRLADDLGAATVAFPAVSAGLQGWPIDTAAHLAIKTVRATATHVTDVTFVLFDERAYSAFAGATEPTDEEIATALAANPAGRWNRLFSLADGITPEDMQVRWHGGHPAYSHRVDAIVDSLGDLGVILPFDWPRWHRTSPLFPAATGLAQAPVADGARLATTFIRGERFNDGAIQQALENGALTAILYRLRRWYETEREV